MSMTNRKTGLISSLILTLCGITYCFFVFLLFLKNVDIKNAFDFQMIFHGITIVTVLAYPGLIATVYQGRYRGFNQSIGNFEIVYRMIINDNKKVHSLPGDNNRFSHSLSFNWGA